MQTLFGHYDLIKTSINDLWITKASVLACGARHRQKSVLQEDSPVIGVIDAKGSFFEVRILLQALLWTHEVEKIDEALSDFFEHGVLMIPDIHCKVHKSKSYEMEMSILIIIWFRNAEA